VALVLPLCGPYGARGWFALLALVGLWGGIGVISHPRPIYSALYFILVIVAVAGLLVLMQATFLAAALVIIYAGAILVTYLFVIMLARQGPQPAPYDARARGPFAGVLTGFILLAALTVRLTRAATFGEPAAGPADPTAAGSITSVGTELLTRYIVGVELAGLLLLAALVGAIAVARRRTGTPETEVS